MNRKILLVDDEPNVLAGLYRHLGSHFTVHCASSGVEALRLVEDQGPFAVVLSDMRMPGMDGLELLRELRRRSPHTVRLILSGQADFDVVVAAVNEGEIFRFHTKPVATEVLRASLERAVLRYEMERRTPDMAVDDEHLLRLASDLRTAMADDQLCLYLQPQLRLADHHLVGAEALLRWEHPARGLLLPDQFLDAAEVAGMMGEITTWVIDAACRQIKRWRKEGLNGLRLAANVTAADLADEAFAGYVLASIEHHGVTSRELELELTEGAVLSEVSRTRATMQTLADQGITWSIDDFGSGYSTLGWLRQLPVNKLKIDRSFVTELATDLGCRSIVEGVIGMAANLGIEVLAEGVETDAQLKELLPMGCELVQGYLFGRPMSPENFLKWTTQQG